jgi:hypothetical protein
MSPSTDPESRKFWYRIQKVLGQRFRIPPVPLTGTFTAYHPDSFFVFGEHPEFRSLYRRFTKHNARNNGGDSARLWALILNIKQVLAEGVEGSFAEVGVWRGNTAAVLAAFAREADRDVYLFDTFEGFSKRDLKGVDADKIEKFKDTSLDLVKNTVGDRSHRCHYVKGWFPGSLTDEHQDLRFAVVSLDADLYDPTKSGLEFFYPRLNKGGILLLHDYSSMHWEGSKKAIDEFSAETGEHIILIPDKSGSAFIRKSFD